MDGKESLKCDNYYGLSVSPKIHMVESNPQPDGIGRWGLCGVIRS